MANKTIELTAEERENIYLALSFRCGWIETGTINRAKDLQNAGEGHKVKILGLLQMRKIVELETLMEKLFKTF